VEGTCKRCGKPVKYLTVRPSGEPIVLDTTPTFDGNYRLVGEDRDSCEKMDRPGHQGYQPHDETCPSLDRV
jgi:hypothetical protein